MLSKETLAIFINFIILFIFITSPLDSLYSHDQRIKSNELIIAQAQKNHSIVKKPRIAVSRFENKSAKGSNEIGEGIAEMLANALFATKKFIVLERQAISDVLVEQEFGASGRVKLETAAPIGEIEGADILVMGTITEFEPGIAGTGIGSEMSFDLPGSVQRKIGEVLGIIKGGGAIKKSHVALIIKMIDAKTGRRIASEQVEGSATDIEGLASLSGGILAGSLSGFSKTPMEKAIRLAIEEAVRVISVQIQSDYYGTSLPSSQTLPPVQEPSLISPSKSTPPSSISTFPRTYEERIVYVKWSKASLREGPGANFKTVLEVTKGTALAVLEEKDTWLRVKTEDGKEGWIGIGTISDSP